MEKLKQKKQRILNFVKNIKPSNIVWSENTIQKIKNFSSQGKMIRGSLFLRTYELLGGKEDMTKVAAALEITQSGILAHDDVMDKDEYRRGMPTIHKQYKKLIENDHYAYSMAICFGDIAFFESFKHIPDKAKNVYSDEMMKCAYGQMQDIHFAYKNEELSIDQILEIYRLKTARYTFSLPMMMAAKLTDKNVELFSRLGEHLGIIFQIIDDEIGIFGDKEEIGKTPGSDIQENKKTLHRYFLLKQNSELKKLYGKKPSPNEIELIRIETTKIKQSINEIIKKHQKKADEIIEKLDCDKTFFKELSNYNLKRRK